MEFEAEYLHPSWESKCCLSPQRIATHSLKRQVFICDSHPSQMNVKILDSRTGEKMSEIPLDISPYGIVMTFNHFCDEVKLFCSVSNEDASYCAIQVLSCNATRMEFEKIMEIGELGSKEGHLNCPYVMTFILSRIASL